MLMPYLTIIHGTPGKCSEDGKVLANLVYSPQSIPTGCCKLRIRIDLNWLICVRAGGIVEGQDVGSR